MVAAALLYTVALGFNVGINASRAVAEALVKFTVLPAAAVETAGSIVIVPVAGSVLLIDIKKRTIFATVVFEGVAPAPTKSSGVTKGIGELTDPIRMSPT